MRLLLSLFFVLSFSFTSAQPFEKDCNQSMDCVQNVLKSKKWTLIQTKGTMYDPCNKRVDYLYEFLKDGAINVYQLIKSNCQPDDEKLIETYKYEFIKMDHQQIGLRIYKIDTHMGALIRSIGMEASELPAYFDYQFLYNPKEAKLVLRSNSNSYSEQSYSSIFK